MVIACMAMYPHQWSASPNHKDGPAVSGRSHNRPTERTLRVCGWGKELGNDLDVSLYMGKMPTPFSQTKELSDLRS